MMEKKTKSNLKKHIEYELKKNQRSIRIMRN